LALAAAIGWPAALFYNDPDLQKLTCVAGALVFAFALVTLGVSWALGIAPRSRRTVVLHVLTAGLLASLAAPWALSQVLAAVAAATSTGASAPASMSAWLAAEPLAIILGLPTALMSGIVFAWIALVRPRMDDGADVLGDHIFTRDVQPFR
jgi:hypothetical protein